MFQDLTPGGCPEIDGLPWASDPMGALQSADKILQRVIPNQVGQWLRSLDGPERDRVLERSTERASHYKWFVTGKVSGHQVWLHEYKNVMATAGLGSFAASIHNHRYSFVSKVLRGRLQVVDYMLVEGSPQPTLRREIGAGETYSVDSEDIHSVDFAERGTVTLLVQTPPVRHYSIIYDRDFGPFEAWDLTARLHTLPTLLTNGRVKGTLGEK